MQLSRVNREAALLSRVSLSEMGLGTLHDISFRKVRELEARLALYESSASQAGQWMRMIGHKRFQGH